VDVGLDGAGHRGAAALLDQQKRSRGEVVQGLEQFGEGFVRQDVKLRLGLDQAAGRVVRVAIKRF
jgi:hypothetical protein